LAAEGRIYLQNQPNALYANELKAKDILDLISEAQKGYQTPMA